MFNYSNINLESLKKDLELTIRECNSMVDGIKSSQNVSLSHFNELESVVYDLSGRIAFLGDVHPDEKIREFGNEADSEIQNFALQIFNDPDIYKKFNEIQINASDAEEVEFHKDLEIDFNDAGHSLTDENKGRLLEIDKKLIQLGISFSENIAKDKTELQFSEDELRGLSNNELTNLRKSGEKFVITMSYPDINAVMENCIVRKTRETTWKAFNNRAVNENLSLIHI